MSDGDEARTIARVETFVFVLASVVVSLIGVAIRSGHRSVPPRTRAADWLAAAEACGLQGVSTTFDGRERRLHGRRGDIAVSLSASVFHKNSGTKVRFQGLVPWLEVSGRPEGLRLLGGTRGLTLGDAAFDDAFDVRGQRVGVQALFGSEVRRCLAEAFVEHDGPGADLVALRAGKLIAQVDDGAPGTLAPRLTALLGSLLTACAGLRATDGFEARLAGNARHDPQPSFRLRCLEVLLQERPEHPATADALRTALADSDGGVRLTAALASPAEGRTVLLEVARDDASSDAVASRALSLVGASIDGVELERILAVALGAGKEATVVACLEALAREGARHVPAIVRVLDSDAAPRAAAAARALGATATAHAAPALVRALAHADAAVREAAASALGRVGANVADVLALRQAEAQHAWDGAFLRAARGAIASVQSRLVGADRGQLSVAPAAGEVSLAEDASGRVSPPKSE
ncbi:MAG: hypothetical protein ABW221_24855 [Vicinamibacteria bacterium]